MAVSRYNKNSLIPQPIRKIIPATTDILHPLRQGERIDNLSQKYYKQVGLGFVIMCANPEYYDEFEIPFDTYIRIPFPLQRVWDQWNLDGEI